MSLSSIIGQASRGADLYFVFRFLRLLTMDYKKTDAYKFKIIDSKGKALRKSADLESIKEKASYTMLHRMVFKIRRLMEKIPGGRFVNYAAALFLLKEQKDARIWTDDGYMKSKLLEFLETDWEADAKFLKEEVDNMDKKSFKSFLSENKTIEESQELQAMMALDDAGIEAVIDKKGKIVIDKKDKKKAEKALKKSFRKGGVPEIQYEEVEVNENLVSQGKKALEKAGIKVRQKDTKLFVAKKDRGKASDILIKTIHRDAWFSDDAPMLRNEEVELEEAVNLKKLKKEYEKNEDDNYHRENYLLLAKAFGTKSEIKKVEEIMKRSEANNSTSQKDNDWMYKNIMPYYNKIRNEEVEIGEKIEKESYGSFITAAAKAKKEGKKTFMMGGKKYPVTIKQKISAAYEEAKLYAAKGTAYPATIDTLKMIVREKQNQTVMFKSGKAIVDLFTASAMVQVYDALKKPEMKKTFEKMIGDKAGFLKTQAFAMKMISGGK